jgi:hypothetical protein
MEIPFSHHQSAHCETGVVSNLITHYGLNLSEAMVFGIGSGLFFGHFPFIRLHHLPLTAFRISTGGIMKRVVKRLGIGVSWDKFKDPDQAMRALDRLLERNVPVGCRSGAYWLSYFPRRYRFHFNMHNLVVIGKQGEEYIISDPVFPEPVRCPEKDLRRARFARGAMAPRGRMYHVTRVPENPDFVGAILRGMNEVCRTMLRAPGPFLGVRGIRYLSKRVRGYPEKLGEEKTGLYLSQIIRMQEEIGTGGAGFRFLYSAFLQEAGSFLEHDGLLELSERMTRAGDTWREFALIGSRICKHKVEPVQGCQRLGELLAECADMEESIFTELRKILQTRGK